MSKHTPAIVFVLLAFSCKPDTPTRNPNSTTSGTTSSAGVSGMRSNTVATSTADRYSSAADAAASAGVTGSFGATGTMPIPSVTAGTDVPEAATGPASKQSAESNDPGTQ